MGRDSTAQRKEKRGYTNMEQWAEMRYAVLVLGYRRAPVASRFHF